MKKLLNTLYITTPDRYLSLDGENIVIFADRKEIGRIPLHNLERIMAFGSAGGRSPHGERGLKWLWRQSWFRRRQVAPPTGSVD